jgi:hypothetical protein
VPPSEETRRAWSKSNWNGCKWHGACGGTRCVDGDPYPATHRDPELRGRRRWKTPIRFPWEAASAALSPSDRRFSGCPVRDCDGWIWEALSAWNSWRALGRPLLVPGALSEQPARLADALRILDDEQEVIKMAHAEEARKG